MFNPKQCCAGGHGQLSETFPIHMPSAEARLRGRKKNDVVTAEVQTGLMHVKERVFRGHIHWKQ